MTDYLHGKRVLVTGGTGSLGRALVPKILSRGASAVCVYSRTEVKQADMRADYAAEWERMRFFIGDVRDLERLRRAFTAVDVVIHAAALKRIDTAEYDPDEFQKTNCVGSMNVNSAAIDCGVKRCMLISTDKAAAASTLYGATKAVAERTTIAANAYSGALGTAFSCVRYGNVVASTGSIVPIFRKQAATGGPLTLTHKAMTRFWLTLDQATDFVLQAVEDQQGGETFVPQIPAARVADLAEAIAPGMATTEIGIRAGEKLHEELITVEEGRRTLWQPEHKRYVIAPSVGWQGTPPKGVNASDGFSYSSATGPHMSVEEIRAMLKEAGL